MRAAPAEDHAGHNGKRDYDGHTDADGRDDLSLGGALLNAHSLLCRNGAGDADVSCRAGEPGHVGTRNAERRKVRYGLHYPRNCKHRGRHRSEASKASPAGPRSIHYKYIDRGQKAAQYAAKQEYRAYF